MRPWLKLENDANPGEPLWVRASDVVAVTQDTPRHNEFRILVWLRHTKNPMGSAYTKKEARKADLEQFMHGLGDVSDDAYRGMG